jgi:hypothetical protein
MRGFKDSLTDTDHSDRERTIEPPATGRGAAIDLVAVGPTIPSTGIW